MEKARRFLVNIVSVIFIILIIKEVKIPQVVYFILVGIILSNQPIEEWKKYSQTKNKKHLIMPIFSVIILIFVVFKLIY